MHFFGLRQSMFSVSVIFDFNLAECFKGRFVENWGDVGHVRKPIIAVIVHIGHFFAFPISQILFRFELSSFFLFSEQTTC